MARGGGELSPKNLTEAVGLLSDRFGDGWVDGSTRAVIMYLSLVHYPHSDDSVDPNAVRGSAVKSTRRPRQACKIPSSVCRVRMYGE